ncbi:hypothetical protein R5R35_011958 [Gryllus longicercus]|uniref:Arrestin C-terminal-like domain-containing protein n=1 Tax=Gryllus longicercus TaxID=2509291 RepID=A0AAN9VF20_9ORTH
MSVQKFEIKFDNPACIYYAGQQVTGCVTLITTKEKKIRGEAEVKWTKSVEVVRDGKSETEYEDYCANEIYAQMEVWLVGASHGDMVLPSGEHVYPFSYILPYNIPSSFEGSYGHVRYTVKVKVDRPWKFDYDCKVAFTVLTPLDLNLEPNMQEPVQNTKEKYLCCCCCRSGPITLVANVLRGFVPGQKIAAVVECDNVTSEEVSVKCYLEKIVTFRASCGYNTDTKEDESTVVMERLGTVGGHDSKTWTTNLTVPSLPASYLKYCECIDITYTFVVKGSFSGLHNAMKLNTEVIIGTIPLKNYFPSIVPLPPVFPCIPALPQVGYPPSPPLPPSFNEAIIASPSAPPVEPGTPYPDLPPPNYEECMLSKGNIRNAEDSGFTYGTMDFAPRYPMYNFR